MNIGIDIDNVISNFNEELLKEFMAHDKELRNSGIVNSDAYITRGMFDWSKDEFDDFYYKNIERIAKNLKVIDKAPEYIKRLREEGYKIYIISGRNNGEYSNPYQMTKDWLKKYDIQYDKLILTDVFDSYEKAKICLENNINIMVDDSSRIQLEVDKTRVTAFLMDTPYNRQIDSLIRVHNWKEIYEFIINFKREKIDVILDTDAYNECDDQFALAYMLKNQDIFNVEAITVAPYFHNKSKITIKEGQDLSYNEILKICRWLNFDTNNKVFKGSTDYIKNGYKEENDAVNKIIDTALKNDKTYILAIGAITNIALAIEKEPKIIDKIEVVWLGGHSLLQDNNDEFNFKQDIEADRIVFNSKVNLTIIPCKNVASNLETSIYELKHFLENKGELCNYLLERFYNDGYHGIQERRVLWDISVIAYMINKSWFVSKKISCPNINDNTSYELTTNKHLITIINDIKSDRIIEDMLYSLMKN